MVPTAPGIFNRPFNDSDGGCSPSFLPGFECDALSCSLSLVSATLKIEYATQFFNVMRFSADLPVGAHLRAL